MQIPPGVTAALKEHGQEHLVQFWDQLNEDQQKRLAKQVRELDLVLVDKLLDQRDRAKNESGPADDRAARAESPSHVVRLPKSPADQKRDADAAEIGQQLMNDGKVGAILVAGGQGSRLGFDDPKGMFPIGPVSDRTLFRVLCEQIKARSQRAGQVIPYFIMTSEATHLPTVAFFEKNDYFGLGEDNVYFFQQASLPAVDDSSRKILLERPDRIATSPDGHGGVLRALERGGMLGVMRDRGIEHLYYHQVDNPTAIVCDPVFLGHHIQSDSDLSTKVVEKVGPEEKMGVVASVDGTTEIIEYSDLAEDQSRRTNPDGSLVFWAGNTAIHVFRREFIERLLADELSLPFHIAHKKVACIDEQGKPVEPDSPNANKFEQFIFDSLPHAKVALVMEASRQREFNPVKNAEGSDSPATSRAALCQLAREWIESAGGRVEKDVAVEISPLFALDAEELQSKLEPGRVFKKPEVLE